MAMFTTFGKITMWFNEYVLYPRALLPTQFCRSGTSVTNGHDAQFAFNYIQKYVEVEIIRDLSRYRSCLPVASYISSSESVGWRGNLSYVSYSWN